MNLGLALRALGRHKVLVTFGIVVGVILAALSQYAVTMAPDGLEFTRRSHSTYSASAALVVDVPGLGVVRSDLPMDKNMQMAPTFAYLATTPDVLERVERTTGPLKDRVLITVEPVQYSPVVAYSVEGKDRALVAQVATELPKALSEYVSEYQDTGDVGSDVRLILRPLGSSGPPIEVQSRAIEIAALLFLLPVLAAVGLAFMLESGAGSGEAPRAQAVEPVDKAAGSVISSVDDAVRPSEAPPSKQDAGSDSLRLEPSQGPLPQAPS